MPLDWGNSQTAKQFSLFKLEDVFRADDGYLKVISQTFLL